MMSLYIKNDLINLIGILLILIIYFFIINNFKSKYLAPSEAVEKIIAYIVHNKCNVFFCKKSLKV